MTKLVTVLDLNDLQIVHIQRYKEELTYDENLTDAKKTYIEEISGDFDSEKNEYKSDTFNFYA